MHCTAGDAPVAVKTFVKHTLSKELQLYYEVRRFYSQLRSLIALKSANSECL